MKKLALLVSLVVLPFFSSPSLAGHDAKSCETECKGCAAVCQKALDYCLKKGGSYKKPEHVKLMKDCIAICNANGDLRSRDSKFADEMSKICSKVCAECAASCESFKDEKLKNCVETCKKCSDCCSN